MNNYKNTTKDITDIIRFEKCSRVKTAKIVSLLFHDITNLSIPQFVELDGEYCEIVEIGPAAFANNQVLEQVALPPSVVTICDYGFYGCTALKSIQMPGVSQVGKATFASCISLELDTINFCFGDEAFMKCESLSSLTITEESHLYIVPPAAFRDCKCLKDIQLPESVHSILHEAFLGCVNLRQIVFPLKLKEVDSRAFYECERLQTVSLNDGLERIEHRAFAKCRELSETYIPDSVNFVGEEAFCGCHSLNDIRFSANTKNIPPRCFMWCKSLEFVEIPSGVTSIGEEAFTQCQSLYYIELPSSIVDVDADAFDCCPAIVERKRSSS